MIELLRIWRKRKKVEPTFSSRTEVCISGSGGQGIILAGIILSEAASLYEGKNVVQTQSYGPEARGGASRCEIVISEGEIYYPKTTSLDILLTMEQEALDKYISRLKKGGVLILDSTMIKDSPKNINSGKVYSLPFTRIANQLGNIIVANMVALGALVASTDLVSLEAIKKAISNRVKERFVELDIKALLRGFEETKKWLGTETNEITRISG